MESSESNCFKRKCVNYIGVRELEEGTVSSGRHICVAFMFGIPDVMTYGENLHLTPLEDQRNDIVYEKEGE